MPAPSPITCLCKREGFILVNHETKMTNFYDENEIRDLYYKGNRGTCKTDLRRPKRVVVFDHTLRSADEAMREEKQISGPVRHARNDSPIVRAAARRDQLPDEAQELFKRRVAIDRNLPPINKPVEGSRWRLLMRVASERRNWSPARGFTRIGSAKPLT